MYPGIYYNKKWYLYSETLDLKKKSLFLHVVLVEIMHSVFGKWKWNVSYPVDTEVD